MKAAVDWTRKCVDGDLPLGQGIAFIGEPGRGKTAVACAVLNEVASTMHAAEVDITTGYTTFEGYLKRERRQMTLEARLKRGEDADDLADLRALEQSQIEVRNDIDLLLIDDVGKEHRTGTEYAEDELDFLLRFRYDLGKTTVLTSNLPVAQWARRYSAAMESFIHEAFVIVKADGRDYRK